MKIFVFALILTCCSTLLFSQVNFELDFSFEKINPDYVLTNLQLFDYNNDGVEEIIVSYKEDLYLEADGKCVIYNQIGDTLLTIPFDCGTERIFKHASLFGIDSITYLASFFLYSDNNLWEGQTFYLFEIYQLDNMSLIGSEMVYLGNNIFDYENFNYTVNFIENLVLESELCLYVGINKIHSSGILNICTFFENFSHLFRYQFQNLSLCFIDEFETIGREIKINNEINKILVLGDSLRTSSFDPGAHESTAKRYKIVTFENEYNPIVQYIDYVSGGQSWDMNGGTSNNNFILQSKFLSNNDLNINELGVVFYNKIIDDENGTTINFKNYSPDFSDTLWIKDDTQIGTSLITSSTCISVNNEEHYIMYFRGNQLEIRDRINGNIIHQQDTSISPFTIRRKSDGELLFFVEQEDETGYDVYVLEGEIQVSADDSQLPIANYELQNYPNPFNPETTINFNIEQNQQNELIEINIFNVKGQRVKSLHIILNVVEHRIEGRGQNNDYSITWRGVDQNNNPVSSGIYFYQLKVDGEVKQTKKMILMK